MSDMLVQQYEEEEPEELSGLELEKAIERKKNEVVIAAGFSYEDENGEDVPDMPALRQAAALAISAAVVRNRDDRAKVGLSSHDLYAQVLPDAPGADGTDPGDYVEAVVKAKLVRFLWGVTQTQPGGFVQKQLTGGMVLVRSKVHRGHDPVQVVYVTDDHELLMTDSLQPEIDDLVKRANKLHQHAEMLVHRQHTLAPAVSRAITTGTRRAATDARLELPAGEAE